MNAIDIQLPKNGVTIMYDTNVNFHLTNIERSLPQLPKYWLCRLDWNFLVLWCTAIFQVSQLHI